MDADEFGSVLRGGRRSYIAHGVMYAVQSSFIASCPAQVRCTGTSMGYQLKSIIGGGLAPIIAVALLSSTGGTLAISAYTAAALVVTAVCVLLARDRRGSDLRQPQERPRSARSAGRGSCGAKKNAVAAAGQR